MCVLWHIFVLRKCLFLIKTLKPCVSLYHVFCRPLNPSPGKSRFSSGCHNLPEADSWICPRGSFAWGTPLLAWPKLSGNWADPYVLTSLLWQVSTTSSPEALPAYPCTLHIFLHKHFPSNKFLAQLLLFCLLLLREPALTYLLYKDNCYFVCIFFFF